jgi:hypothetical protein
MVFIISNYWTSLIGKIFLSEPQPSSEDSVRYIRFSLPWISQSWFFNRARWSALCSSPNLVHALSPQLTGWPCYYTQAWGSLFVAFYDSKGYGWSILTRLHMGRTQLKPQRRGFFFENKAWKTYRSHEDMPEVGLFIISISCKTWVSCRCLHSVTGPCISHYASWMFTVYT